MPRGPAGAARAHAELWRELLLQVGFMEEEKALHMMLGLRRAFSRGPLSQNDVRILMGIARQVRWKLRTRGKADA